MLTPAEFDLIIQKLNISKDIMDKSRLLFFFMANIKNRTDPTNPYNENETFTHITDLFLTSYNQFKADLQNLVNTL